MSEFLFNIVDPSGEYPTSDGTYQGTFTTLLNRLQLKLQGEQQRDIYLDGQKVAEITRNFHWVDPTWSKRLLPPMYLGD